MAYDDYQLLEIEVARGVARAVVDAPPIEIGSFLFPITKAHDMPECPMLLGKVLKFVIVQIASQANRGQHQDLPVVQTLASTIVARGMIDILGDKMKNLITQLRLAINVLQGSQEGNEFVATLQIEFNFGYGLTIEPRLI